MSTEVVTTSKQRLVEFLAAAENQAPRDPKQAALDIVERILASESVEEVLGETQAIHARDVLGNVLTIVGFTFNQSTLGGDGPAFYMLIDCADPNGETFKVTCGAVNVMAQLYRLNELGALPGLFRIVESGKETAAGFKPMWLKAVEPGEAPTNAPGSQEASF